MLMLLTGWTSVTSPTRSNSHVEKQEKLSADVKVKQNNQRAASGPTFLRDLQSAGQGDGCDGVLAYQSRETPCQHTHTHTRIFSLCKITSSTEEKRTVLKSHQSTARSDTL